MAKSQLNYHKLKASSSVIETRWFKVFNIIVISALILIGFFA